VRAWLLAGARDSELSGIYARNELPSGLYKNNGNPTIDSNFFKSMTKTIKANRASIVDAELCC
jgi:hypothetical protein